MARRYAIKSLAEARDYLEHPLLGARLLDCCALVCAHVGSDALAIFGSPDDLKLRSSATLFAAVADHPAPYELLLTRFFAGAACPRTLEVVADWRTRAAVG